MDYLNESPASVSISSNFSWSPISCDSFNSNYIISSKIFAKVGMICTKNMSITDVTKSSVNSKPLNNSKPLLNDQKNLGSNLHRVENPSKTIFGQININSIRISLICFWISSKMKLILLWTQKLRLAMVFQNLDLLWQVTQFLSGLIWQIMGVEDFCLPEKILLVKYS